MRYQCLSLVSVIALSGGLANAQPLPEPSDAGSASSSFGDTTLPASSEAELPPTPGTRAPSRVIEEIIVTSQKREQSLQDVPISVSTFDGDFMKEKAIVDVGELVKYTPNVRLSDVAIVAPILTIRGLGTPPSATGVEPSVGLVIDDVSYGRTSYINDAVFDLQRIEVLRGPQGTLFGKNTLAGVMSLTTVSPDFTGAGFATAGIGSFNQEQFEGAQSFTVVEDVLAARVALRYRDRDTGVYNTARDEDNRIRDLAGRFKLKWFIADNADLLVNAWFSKVDSLGVPWQLCEASERSLGVMRRYDPEVEADCYDRTNSTNSVSDAERTTQSLSFQYNQDLGDIGFVNNSQVTAIASWSEIEQPYRTDVDFSPLPFLETGTKIPDHYEQKQLELRFSGDTGAPFGLGNGVDFLVGIFGGTSKANTSTFVRAYYEGLLAATEAGAPVAPGTVPAPEATNLLLQLLGGAVAAGQLSETYFSLTESDTWNMAFFSQFDWHIKEQLTATLGLRYEAGSREGSVSAGSEQALSLLQPILGYENFQTSLKDSDREFSPKLTLAWQLNPSVTVFGTVAEGFKSGGFASGVYVDHNLKYKPENGISYEAGIKTKILENALVFNATAFHTIVDDLQVRSFDGRTFQVSNAAGAEATGVEIDFLWAPPLSWLTVGGSAGITQTEYTGYRCGPGAATAAAGSGPEECQPDGISLSNQPAFRDFSGEQLPFAPETSAALYLSTDFPFGDGWHFVSGLDILHQGEAIVGEGDIFTQSATTKLSARIGVRTDNGFALILNGRNLTGEEELVWGIDQPNLPGNLGGMTTITDPTWQLDLRYDW